MWLPLQQWREVNDAKVVQADIECTNGVIHAIDTVLILDAAVFPPPALIL